MRLFYVVLIILTSLTLLYTPEGNVKYRNIFVSRIIPSKVQTLRATSSGKSLEALVGNISVSLSVKSRKSIQLLDDGNKPLDQLSFTYIVFRESLNQDRPALQLKSKQRFQEA